MYFQYFSLRILILNLFSDIARRTTSSLAKWRTKKGGIKHSFTKYHISHRQLSLCSISGVEHPRWCTSFTSGAKSYNHASTESQRYVFKFQNRRNVIFLPYFFKFKYKFHIYKTFFLN